MILRYLLLFASFVAYGAQNYNVATPAKTPVSGAIPLGNGTNWDSGILVAGTGITLTHVGTNLTIDASGGGGSGTVTSVGLTVPSIFSVTGSPVTTSGTLAVSYSGTALPIANGGTSATTAAGARTALGLFAIASSGSATDLTSGTVPDARFPSTLPAVSGVNLTALNASNLGSGTAPTARLGTGTANSTTFLRGDNTWATPSGSGDVVGPGSSTDNSLAIYDGTTGKLLKSDAGITYDSTGNILTATGFVGSLTGNVTGNVSGTSGSTTGNAATVTFVDAGGDTTTFVALGTTTTGSLSPATDVGLTYNATTDALTTTTFIGALSGNATTATTLATTRSIYGNNFNGSADLTQVIASTYGGTGNGFTKFSGPITSEKTFTLPNASATVLTDNATVTVAQGGTGATTFTDAGVLIGNGAGAVQVTGAGTAGQVLTSNGAGVDPTFQTNARYKYAPAGFVADGGGSVVTTGKVKGFTTVRQAGTITAWNIAVDTGTCTVKVWKIATGTAVPTISNVINTSGVSISSGTYIRSTTTSDFTTTSVAANDILAYDITAVSGATEVTFGLEITVQ